MGPAYRPDAMLKKRGWGVGAVGQPLPIPSLLSLISPHVGQTHVPVQMVQHDALVEAVATQLPVARGHLGRGGRPLDAGGDAPRGRG